MPKYKKKNVLQFFKIDGRMLYAKIEYIFQILICICRHLFPNLSIEKLLISSVPTFPLEDIPSQNKQTKSFQPTLPHLWNKQIPSIDRRAMFTGPVLSRMEEMFTST
jgi:hypothetical protein